MIYKKENTIQRKFKKLGQGQFGSVFLVKSKKFNKNLYAIKAVPNSLIKELNLEKHMEQERIVLQMMNFPLIINFVNELKDEFNTYFVTEFIKGLELFDVIREIGLLSTSDSQFYIGSLILSLEYLHLQFIIYRDLKPENVMIYSQGYLKLIDMGTAKIVKAAKIWRGKHCHSKDGKRKIYFTIDVLHTIYKE